MSVLTIDDVVADYEAVVESGPALNGLFAPNDRWPDGLTLRDNIVDLGWHEKEFERRSSFAWGLWRRDRSRYLGTAYVLPNPTGITDAHAVHWFRQGENDPILRSKFKFAWEEWVRQWPIGSIRFSP
ncbi:MAG: GNAT family N-acetyltransferase [Pseudomonadota bacterium]